MVESLTTAERFRRLDKLVKELGAVIGAVVGELEDEGDRVYLGSTNHKNMMAEAAELFDRYRIMGELPP